MAPKVLHTVAARPIASSSLVQLRIEVWTGGPRDTRPVPKSLAATCSFLNNLNFAIVHAVQEFSWEMSVKGLSLWDLTARTFDFCCLQSV
jgi:hypothetical protein